MPKRDGVHMGRNALGDYRITFPGGEVTLGRISNKQTWVHVYVSESPAVQMEDLRIDHPEKHSPETAQIIADALDRLPLRECYHLAVLVKKEDE